MLIIAELLVRSESLEELLASSKKVDITHAICIVQEYGDVYFFGESRGINGTVKVCVSQVKRVLCDVVDGVRRSCLVAASRHGM